MPEAPLLHTRLKTLKVFLQPTALRANFCMCLDRFELHYKLIRALWLMWIQSFVMFATFSCYMRWRKWCSFDVAQKGGRLAGGWGGGIMNIYGGLGFHAQAVHNRKLPASTTLKFNHGWNEKEKESWSRQGPSGQFRVKRLWGGPKSNRQGGDLMCHGWKSPLS